LQSLAHINLSDFKIPVITTHHLGGAWSGLGGAPDNSPTNIHNLGCLNISAAMVISHASFITPKDAGLLRATNQYISITPESEMHYGHLHAHSHLVSDQASLGVDTHFTFSGDILTQTRLWLQITRYRLFDEVGKRWQLSSTSPMSVEQAFLLATRNGGLAVRRPDLGVIEVGAKADLVVWDGDSPAMLGWRDPVAAIILHASVADVLDVMVDGKFVKRNGKLTTPKYRETVQRFRESSKRLQDIWVNMPLPAQDGNWFYSDMKLGHPLRVDVQRGPGDGYGKSGSWKSLLYYQNASSLS
jgi:hypothetical protein